MINLGHTHLEKLIMAGKVGYLSTVLTAQETPVEILWRTGDASISFISSFSSTLKTVITIKEAVSVSSPGTATPTLNRNRNYPDNPVALSRFNGPTYTGGTVISTDQSGAETAPGQSEASAATEARGILRKNTDYVVTITPSAACDIILEALFWEE